MVHSSKQQAVHQQQTHIMICTLATVRICITHTWAARYNIWLLITLNPKGVGFSFLFFSFLFFSFLFFSFLFFSNSLQLMVLALPSQAIDEH
jgi:hypothetical protein